MWRGGCFGSPPSPPTLPALALAVSADPILSARALDRPATADEDDLPAGDTPPPDDERACGNAVIGYRVLQTDESVGLAETLAVREENKTLAPMSEVLSQAVGLLVRRLGNLGSYGETGIRSAASSRVPVYLDGDQRVEGGMS
jgi:hypothetical protein